MKFRICILLIILVGCIGCGDKPVSVAAELQGTWVGQCIEHEGGHEERWEYQFSGRYYAIHYSEYLRDGCPDQAPDLMWVQEGALEFSGNVVSSEGLTIATYELNLTGEDNAVYESPIIGVYVDGEILYIARNTTGVWVINFDNPLYKEI